MGVEQVGAIYKGFTFDGVSSKTYGVYITGEGVYDAPERDVEMVTIPGRNGAFTLDKGRFNNITVTYTAGMFGGTHADFADGMAALRAALCSRKGYVRLVDDYNPDEYRLAVYRSGLEVDPATLESGQFTIQFDCKPQRFLKSGEAEVNMYLATTITNPTAFASRPLLKVYNWPGVIKINGAQIAVNDVPLGRIVLDEPTAVTGSTIWSYIPGLVSAGDSMAIADALGGKRVKVYGGEITGVVPGTPAGGYQSPSVSYAMGGDGYAALLFNTGELAFTAGTAQTITGTASYTVNYKKNGVSSYITVDLTITTTYQPDGQGGGTIEVKTTAQVSGLSPGQYGVASFSSGAYPLNELVAESTATALGTPTYIDLDIGEAYKISDGEVVGLNSAVELPPTLPELLPGSNQVQKSGSITSLYIVPRWWTV